MIPSEPARERVHGAEALDDPRRDAHRHHGDRERQRQERQAGVDRVVAEHALEVERAEEERREHARDEQAAHEARAHQHAQAQDAQRHDRVLQARLQRRGTRRAGRARRRRRRACAPRVRPYSLDFTIANAPAIVASVISTEPSHVDAAAQADALVLLDQRRAEHERDDADRHVHEEDPVPVERLRQHAAREQADRAAAGGDERVQAHRLGLLGLRSGNSVTMIARITLEATAPPTPCKQARADQQRLAVGDPAQHRGRREQHEAREEHALAPDQVAEPPGQQQEAAEGDQVAVRSPR